MIFRIWHGWTSHDDADAYQRLVHEEVVPDILERDLPGLRHVDRVAGRRA